MNSECLNLGFICRGCLRLHDGHKVVEALTFLEELKKLVNYDGTYKTPNSIDILAAKIESKML